MKRYTLQTIRTLYNRGGEVQKPSPFPGQYPTRIAWSVLRGDKKISYIGKPTALAIKTFYKQVNKGDRTRAAFYEFDKFCCIQAADHIIGEPELDGEVFPREYMPGLFPMFKHHRLWAVYHHLNHAWRTQAGNQFLIPQIVKKIGGYKTYSPKSILKLEEVAAYKNELIRLGVPVK